VRKAKAQPDNTVNAILRAGQLVDGNTGLSACLGRAEWPRCGLEQTNARASESR
jgi:hypothetical protein